MLWESVPFIEDAIAKPRLPMAFLRQAEERDSQFPRVRLLVLLKDDKYVGWENAMALNVMRLYLNKIWYEMGSNMACSIKSKDNSTKDILNLLAFSHIIFIYAIE